MDLIVCISCGRPVARALDPNARVKATCSACLPDPTDTLRFSIALAQARRLSGHKVEYCAARAGVTREGWRKWEAGANLRPPYDRRDKLLSLFADTPGARVMLEEVQRWPG